MRVRKAAAGVPAAALRISENGRLVRHLMAEPMEGGVVGAVHVPVLDQLGAHLAGGACDGQVEVGRRVAEIAPLLDHGGLVDLPDLPLGLYHWPISAPFFVLAPPTLRFRPLCTATKV